MRCMQHKVASRWFEHQSYSGIKFVPWALISLSFSFFFLTFLFMQFSSFIMPFILLYHSLLYIRSLPPSLLFSSLPLSLSHLFHYACYYHSLLHTCSLAFPLSLSLSSSGQVVLLFLTMSLYTFAHKSPCSLTFQQADLYMWEVQHCYERIGLGLSQCSDYWSIEDRVCDGNKPEG